MKRLTNAELKELAKSNLRDGGKLKSMAEELLTLRRIKSLAVTWIKLEDTQEVETEEQGAIVEDATEAALEALKDALREVL